MPRRGADREPAAFSVHRLADHDWSDFFAAHTREDGMAVRVAQRHASGDCHLRHPDLLTAHAGQLPGRFEEYLEALQPAIQRKVCHRRSRLTTPVFTLHARERD